MQQKTLIRAFSILGIVIAIMLKSHCAHAFVSKDRISMAKSLAHYTMGQVYDLLGLTNRAVFEYEKASQFDESSYLIHLRLGADYARLDMLEEAENSLSLVHRYNADDLQSHYLLALIYSTQRKYDKAAEEYELILKKFSKVEPQNIEIYGYLGQLYYSQKKYAQAIKQFEKVLDLEPLNADIMYLLGSLYIEIKDEDKAIKVLEKSISINPEHDGSLNTLAYIYAEMGVNLSKAKILIDRALVISPNNGAYLDSLGWVYYKQEKYEQALKVFKKASGLLKDPVIYEHLGDVYYKLNYVEDALKYWQLSLDLLPNKENVKKKIEEVKSSQARKNEK